MIVSDLYDEEIAYFDQQFAQLLDSLRERRLLDRTVIVLAADHGEELYDHNHFGHCRDLAYDTVMKTPLLLRIPGVEPARRGALAENLDIVPTLFDYMGLSESQTFDGKSLRPVIEKDRPIRRLSFGLQGVKRIVSDGTHKLTYDLATGSSQLFDLKSDPAEKTDLAARRPEETGRLQAALLAPLAGPVQQLPLDLEGGDGGRWLTGFPKVYPDGRVFAVDADLLNRGRQRYDIYCAPCHGQAGKGDGMVARRNEALVDFGFDYGLPGKSGYTYRRPFDYFAFQATAASGVAVHVPPAFDASITSETRPS